MKCCICKTNEENILNSSWPISKGCCCDECYFTKVIPKRFEYSNLPTFERKSKKEVKANA